MKDTKQITRLKKLLVVFKEEKERHLKEATHFSGTKAECITWVLLMF